MCKKITKDEFIKRINSVSNGGISVIDEEYYGTQEKYMFKCNHCGYELKTRGYSVLQGHGCRECYNRRNSKNKTFSLEKVQKIVDESGYTTTRNNVWIICKKHGKFSINALTFMHGNGCPKCAKEKNAMSRAIKINDFIDRANELHNRYYLYDNIKEIKNTKEKVEIVCPKHGEFWQTPHGHLQGKGCPKCKSSHLENEIRNFLIENNVDFTEQYRISWLGLQSLDFYLNEYNVGIECQGIQHFESVERFGGECGLNKCKEMDKRKFKKCQENGIKLLYYSNLGIKYPYEVFEDKELLLSKIKNSKISLI
nr:MAG TPA: restriction enzyme [Herelleviridae sp.]